MVIWFSLVFPSFFRLSSSGLYFDWSINSSSSSLHRILLLHLTSLFHFPHLGVICCYYIYYKKKIKQMLQTGEFFFIFLLCTFTFNYYSILSLSENGFINTFRTSRYWIMVTFRIIKYRNDVRKLNNNKILFIYLKIKV